MKRLKYFSQLNELKTSNKNTSDGPGKKVALKKQARTINILVDENEPPTGEKSMTGNKRMDDAIRLCNYAINNKFDVIMTYNILMFSFQFIISDKKYQEELIDNFEKTYKNDINDIIK